MESVLQTERLRLRRFTPDDVDLLVELDSDLEVMRFLTGEATSRAEVETSVLPAILTVYEAHPRLGTYAAYDRAGAFAGWFGLQPTEDPKTADLGWRLRRDVWGRGYATEGARALIELAFTELGLERVVADTMAVNTRSRRVMVKAGLRFHRLYHEHFDDPLPGTEFGEVEYALDRIDWLAGGRG